MGPSASHNAVLSCPMVSQYPDCCCLTHLPAFWQLESARITTGELPKAPRVLEVTAPAVPKVLGFLTQTALGRYTPCTLGTAEDLLFPVFRVLPRLCKSWETLWLFTPVKRYHPRPYHQKTPHTPPLELGFCSGLNHVSPCSGTGVP